jgi:hypothetical protein
VTGGRRNNINVTASHGSATSMPVIGPAESETASQALRWTKRQTIWTIVGVVLALAGTVATLLLT